MGVFVLNALFFFPEKCCLAVASVYIVNSVTKRGKDRTVWLDFFPFFLAHVR